VYKELLVAMKQQVRSVQAKAALAVNSSLIQLYWNMGRMIAENQELFEGKNSYVAQLERDLRAEYFSAATCCTQPERLSPATCWTLNYIAFITMGTSHCHS
jgi:hypothetical protein